MKIENIPTLIFEKEEKEQLTIYLNAIKTLSKRTFCGAIDCDGIVCAQCPFSKLANLDDALSMAITEFLSEYRALQRKNPSLPSID